MAFRRRKKVKRIGTTKRRNNPGINKLKAQLASAGSRLNRQRRDAKDPGKKAVAVAATVGGGALGGLVQNYVAPFIPFNVDARWIVGGIIVGIDIMSKKPSGVLCAIGKGMLAAAASDAVELNTDPVVVSSAAAAAK